MIWVKAIIPILSFFLSCNNFVKKNYDTLPIFDKIHWYHYFQILEIPNSFLIKLENYCNKKNIFCEQVNQSQLYSYYKIATNDVNSVLKEIPNIKTKNDFPFIWWDSNLNLRKNYGIKEIMNGYKDYFAIQSIINYLQKKYPDYIRISTLGKSYQNRDIILIHLTNHKNQNQSKIPLYFNALHHGNELLTIEYVLDMLFLLLGETYIEIPLNYNKKNLLFFIQEEERKNFLNAFDIYLIPIVNPDGLENFWYKSIVSGRKNARNVDLNRNYPFYWNSNVYFASSFDEKAYNFKGKNGGSEKEIQYILNFLLENPCSFSISYHTYANKILFPYTIDHVWNPVPDRAYYFGKMILKDAYSFRKKNYILSRKLYSVDGTDQDWIFNQTGCIAFLVEGSMNLPVYDVAKWSILGIRRIWYNLLNIARTEKRIELEFYEYNQIVKPKIKILNVKFFENEQILFYKNRWIFYLGPLDKLQLNIEYKNINKNIELKCSNICKEKIYLTKLK